MKTNHSCNESRKSCFTRSQLIFHFLLGLFTFSCFSLYAVPGAGTDKNIFFGQSVQIGTSPEGFTYSWSPTTALSNAAIANPVASPVTTTQYIMTAQRGGLIIKDTVIVFVDAIFNGDIALDTPTTQDMLQIVDRFGNHYSPEDIAIPHHSEIAGIFRLHFLDDDLNNTEGFDNGHANGNARRAVLLQVCEDISVLLGGTLANDPYPGVSSPCASPSDPFPDCRLVEIQVRESAPIATMPTGALAVASQYYLATGPGVVHGNVWQMINTGWDPYDQLMGTPLPGQPAPPTQQYYHGFVQVNFDDTQLDWYTNLSSATPSGTQFDLYSVLLHEMLHALGLASLINSSAESSLTGTGTPGSYSLWDTYLSTSSVGAPDVITNPVCYNTGIAATTGDIASGCASIYFNGVNLTGQEIYSPSPYQDGSSLSHFNCITGGGGCAAGYAANNYSLNYCTSQGAAWVQRTPHQNEVFALCDLGYNITNTYGANSGLPSYNNTYTTCATGCPDDLTVAAANDFQEYTTDLTGDPFETPFQTAITFVDVVANGAHSILDNDLNAVEISCVDVLVGGTVANITVNSGTSFTYTPPNDFCGMAIIKYRPENACGNLGNIAFILLWVECPDLPICEASTVCGENLVCYGDFEDFTLGQAQLLTHASNYLPSGSAQNSPDFYSSAAPMNVFINCNNGTSGTANSPTRFVGIVGGCAGSEGVYLPLRKPLVAGNQYTVSVMAKRLPADLVFGCGIGDPQIRVQVSNLPPTDVAFTPTTLATYTVTNAGASNWALYQTNFNAPAIPSATYNFVLVEGVTPSCSYTFIDDVSITEALFELDVTSSVSNTHPCPGNTVTITYEICNNEVTANTEDIDIQLDFPPHLTITGGDFDGGGEATIPDGDLDGNTCIELEVEFEVNVSAIPGLALPVQFLFENGACIDGDPVIDELIPGLPGLTIEVNASETDLCTTDPVTISVTVTNSTSSNLTGIVAEYVLPAGLTMSNPDDFSNVSGSTYSTNPFNLAVSSFVVLTFEVTPTGTVSGIMNTCVDITTAEDACDLPQDCINLNVLDNCACPTTSIATFTWSNALSLNPYTIYELGSNVSVTGTNVVLTDVVIDMDPGITITVANGAVLTLEHCHLYACDELWQGIVVQPGGRLVINDNSLIEDAVYAVDIQGHTSVSNILAVDESTFNKNFIAVNVVNYQQITGTYPFTMENSVFTCRDIPFTNTTWPTSATLKTLTASSTLAEHYLVGGYSVATLKAPMTGLRAAAGVYLDDVGVLNSSTYYEFIVDGDDGNGTINLFDNMWFGVFGENSNLVCRNNAFQYMFYYAFFNTGGHGIHVTNTDIGNSLFKITVEEDNHFYDCPTGIHVEGYNEIGITTTDMRSTQMPVISVPSEGEIGVFVETPYLTVMDISDNTITNIRNGIVFLADVDGAAPTNEGQLIGTVTITENTIQATLDGNSGTPANEYVLNGIIADNTLYVNLPGTETGPIIISDNSLYQVHNGIHAEGWLYFLYNPTYGWHNRVHTTNNYISMRQIEYPDNTPQAQYGIFHLTNYSGIIENNNIQGFDNSFNGWFGIINSDLVNPGAVKPIVKCNTTTETGTGIVFNVATNWVTFHDNYMDNNSFGYVLDGGDIDEQGDDTYASGNRWVNFTSGNFKTYTSNGSDPLNSNIWIDTGDPDQYPTGAFNGSDVPPSFEYDISNGLEAVTTNGNSTTCSPPSGMLMYGGGNERDGGVDGPVVAADSVALTEALVTDSLPGRPYATEQQITARHRAYMMLHMNEGLKSASNSLQSFYAVADAGNIGKLYKTEQALASGNLQLAQQHLSTVTPQNSVEENHKAFYTVYLHMKQGALTALDTTELSRLVHGCAPRDGMAVYQARALHRVIYKDFKTYFDNCPQAVQQQYKVAATTNEMPTSVFKLYPNPNNGNMVLEYALNKGELGIIQLYDVTGKEVAEYELDNTTTRLAISNITLQNGVYTCRIAVNDSAVESHRIVVIK